MLLTFGHGTAERDQILELLQSAGVRSVADIRTAPGSRRFPHVARSALQTWLPAAGIDYDWYPDLGGFRRPSGDSPDTVWRNESFRGYAGHTRTPEFVAAIDALLADAARRRTTVMCSESVWWRCHRRIVADFVTVARGTPVQHLMHDGRLVPHSPTPRVRLREDGLLVYDAGALSLDDPQNNRPSHETNASHFAPRMVK